MRRTTAERSADTPAADLPAYSFTDAELYHRGTETLLASWEAYAGGATGAAVHRLAGVATAVFPNEPERGVYNNALLERDLTAAERADAITAMEAAYETAGVTRFAAWVHESDGAMRSELERRGYTLDEVTRAMGMALDDIRAAPARARPGPGRLVRAPAHRASCPWTSSMGSTPPPSTSSSHVAAARTSPPASRSTSAPTAASTTSELWRRPVDADWAPR